MENFIGHFPPPWGTIKWSQNNKSHRWTNIKSPLMIKAIQSNTICKIKANFVVFRHLLFIFIYVMDRQRLVCAFHMTSLPLLVSTPCHRSHYEQGDNCTLGDLLGSEIANIQVRCRRWTSDWRSRQKLSVQPGYHFGKSVWILKW